MVVTVVRRQLLISTPVLHGTIYMAHATSSISAEQVPSILTFFCKTFIELLNLATSSSCEARLSAGCVMLRWSRKKYLTELLFVYSFIHEFSS